MLMDRVRLIKVRTYGDRWIFIHLRRSKLLQWKDNNPLEVAPCHNMFSYLVLSGHLYPEYSRFYGEINLIHDCLMLLFFFAQSDHIHRQVYTYLYIQSCQKNTLKMLYTRKTINTTAPRFTALLLRTVTFLPDWLWRRPWQFGLICGSFGTRRRIIQQEISRHRCH